MYIKSPLRILTKLQSRFFGRIDDWLHVDYHLLIEAGCFENFLHLRSAKRLNAVFLGFLIRDSLARKALIEVLILSLDYFLLQFSSLSNVILTKTGDFGWAHNVGNVDFGITRPQIIVPWTVVVGRLIETMVAVQAKLGWFQLTSPWWMFPSVSSDREPRR